MPELTPGTSLLLSETPHCAGKQQPENAVALPNHLHRMAPRHSDGQKSLFCPSKSCIPGHGWAKTPVLPNEGRFSQLRMGKSACFAQRRALFPATDGQKCLFCPTKGRVSGFWNPKWQDLGHGGVFFRVRDTKKACFGVRRGGFPGSGTQNGMFWGTGARRRQERRKAEKGITLEMKKDGLK